MICYNPDFHGRIQVSTCRPTCCFIHPDGEEATFRVLLENPMAWSLRRDGVLIYRHDDDVCQNAFCI